MKISNVLPAVLTLVAFVATPIAFTQTASPSPAQAPSPSPAPDASPRPIKIRVSQGVAEANLIHRVEPVYPEAAKEIHLQGTVLVNVTINTAGNIENPHVISGHPVLAQAALDAIMQWKYKPYLLNGQPVFVETTIKISFHL